MPIQMLGHSAELDQEVAGQIFRLDLAPLFLPKTDQCRLVLAHNDPGIRAADKLTAIVVHTHARIGPHI